MKRIATVIMLTMLLTVIAITAHKKQIKSVSTTTIEGVVRTIETETITSDTTKTTTEAVKTTTMAQSETETTTKATTHTTEAQKPKMSEYIQLTESVEITPEQFRRQGVIYADGFKWTWYSERVLPGRGLNIPGRHSDGNYIRDGDGYIVLASCDYEKGTVIQTPFGVGKVYDYCPTSGVIDVYVSW